MQTTTPKTVGRLLPPTADVPMMRALGCEDEWMSAPPELCVQAGRILAFEGPVWVGGEKMGYQDGKHVLLLSSWTRRRLLTTPQTTYKRICLDRVAAFVAFMDAGRAPAKRGDAPEGDNDKKSNQVVLKVPRSCLDSDNAFRAWLLKAAFSQEASAQPLLRLARRREAHSLISYLLQDRSKGKDRLLDICKDYGLSTSYFRKLCKRMLGHNAKSTLSHWRSVNTLLDIVTRSHSILNIGLGNGYSSASHISRDIHRKFGHAPSAFRERSQA